MKCPKCKYSRAGTSGCDCPMCGTRLGEPLTEREQLIVMMQDTMPPNYVTELTDPLVQEEVQKANHYWRNEYKSLVGTITKKSEQPNRFAMNGWSLGKPTIDGTYLRAFDESDEDSDGEVYQFIGGSWYKDGEARVCYGGVWKRVGDMQNTKDQKRKSPASDGSI